MRSYLNRVYQKPELSTANILVDLLKKNPYVKPKDHYNHIAQV